MSIKEQIKNEHILWMGKQDMKAKLQRRFTQGYGHMELCRPCRGCKKR